MILPHRTPVTLARPRPMTKTEYQIIRKNGTYTLKRRIDKPLQQPYSLWQDNSIIKFYSDGIEAEEDFNYLAKQGENYHAQRF